MLPKKQLRFVVGSHPGPRLCPRCAHPVAPDAKRCGYCWTTLAPGVASHA